jgi:hypothetical protein
MARPPTYHMGVTVATAGGADLIHGGW